MGEKNKSKEPNINKKENFLRFLKTFALCIYPDAYKKFSERKIREGLTYFFAVLGISFIISLFAIGIVLNDLGSNIEEEKEKLENLTVEFELEEDIKFKDFRIAEEGNFTNESILITKEAIYYEHWSCLFMPFCFDEKEKIELEDFDSYSESLVSILKFVFIALFIPVVLFYTIYNGLLALLLILIVGLIGKLITRNLKISSGQIFLVGVYASTIPLILWPLTLHLNLHYIPIFAFLLFSILGFFIVGERKHRY